MPYAIMRCKKLKTMGSIASALQHAYRERVTPNADPERTPDNEHLASHSTDEAMGQLRMLLPDKRRKDAVLAVEYVMTASPEWWAKATPAQQADWTHRTVGWLAAKYGHNRIITATMHRDERTPHLSAFVVPLTRDGRLSAKEFIGGAKQMSRDQGSYAEAVKPLGLERGIEGSRATHQRVKTHYGVLQVAAEAQVPMFTVDELKPRKLRPETIAERVLGVSESPEGVIARLNAKVQGKFGPIAENAATAVLERRRAIEMQQTAEQLKKAAAPMRGFKQLFDKLTPDQKKMAAETFKTLIGDMERMGLENERKREVERQQTREREQERGRGWSR
jgi:hypothetical protein